MTVQLGAKQYRSAFIELSNDIVHVAMHSLDIQVAGTSKRACKYLLHTGDLRANMLDPV